MIKLTMFDVGETLIHDQQPLPNVHAALDAINRFVVADGTSLILSVVSDYLPPEPPATESKIAVLERQFWNILQAARLDKYFEPPTARVTLSSRAGASKPDRRIFELAIARSGTQADLSECIFVSENPAHLTACRQLGMTVLRFGSGQGIQPTFDDWLDAPGMLAALISPDISQNFGEAAAALLTVRHSLTSFHTLGPLHGSTMRGEANRLAQLVGPELGSLDGVFVELTTSVELTWSRDGRLTNVSAPPVDAEDLADAKLFVASLIQHNQVALPGKPARQATHAIELDSAGRRRLVRRHFSAY